MSKRRMQWVSALAVSVGLFAASGCGSSGGGGGGGSGQVTSVDGTKALNALSATEATQLCKDAGAYASAALSKQNSCKFAALFGAAFGAPTTDAEARAACMTIYTACLSAPAQSDKLTCDPIPSTCKATVAQYSACMKDGIAAVNQTFAAIPSCSTLTLADLADNGAGGAGGAGGATTSAACMAFQTACPDYNVPSAM